MNSSKKVLIFMSLYILIIQFFLQHFIPVNLVYENRLIYEVIKDDSSDIDVALKAIKRIIKKEAPRDYIIFLGDSVGYGRPDSSKLSVTYFLNELAKSNKKDFLIFNLSIPAMQTGDYYTILLMLDKYGISHENVILDISYMGFSIKETNDPYEAVYWFNDELLEYGFKTWYKSDKSLLDKTKSKIAGSISVFQYRNYIQYYFETIIEDKIIKSEENDEPVLPWCENPFVVNEIIHDPFVKKSVSDAPIKMDSSNPQVYFLDLIIKMQKDKNLFVYLSPSNHGLLKEDVAKEGYRENLERISQYFKDADVKYTDCHFEIEDKYFSDHIHLTPSGYKKLAHFLWDDVSEWMSNNKGAN